MIYDIEQIKDILPHREPFIFVDRVTELEKGKSIVAFRKITGEEDFFKGHYPNRPIMPGVLQCECVFQAGALLIGSDMNVKGDMDKVPVVTRIQNVRFKKPIKPGDLLELKAEIVEKLGDVFVMKGSIRREGKTITMVEFCCTLAEIEL